jgi:uncharacterized protein (DUF58 family)
VLTRRGWLVLAGSVPLGVGGRLLGMVELYVLAAASVVLPLLAVWRVRAIRLRLRATRELRPPRVHAGNESRVELAVRNLGTRRTPVLAVRDPFDDGRRQARFLLAPLEAGEEGHAAYRLPTGRRGIYGVGPLDVGVSDPFGLAAVWVPAAPRTELTVYPHLDKVAPLPSPRGHDPLAGVEHARALGPEGDDFYALRAYEVGDDLRRVHWPSTARTGELMIRQDQMPWQARATVLLDVRRTTHTPTSFELAVSAACSLLHACWQRRFLVRLVTTAGFDSSFAAGQGHMSMILEQLATVAPTAADDFVDVLGGLRRAGNSGSLAAVVAAAPDRDLDAVARLRSRFGVVTVVRFEPSSYDAGASRRPAPGSARPGAAVVSVTAEAPFPEAWNTQVRPPWTVSAFPKSPSSA